MQRKMIGAALALALFVTINTSNSQGTDMNEHAKIQETIDAMTTAFAKGEIDSILATYEPGAIVVGAPGQVSKGTDALRQMFGQFIALKPEFTFTLNDAVQADDLAIHYNTWKMKGKMPDGSVVEQGGLSVVVLRKQADGRWLMVIDDPFGDRLLRK